MSAETVNWLVSSPIPILDADETHVWRADLDVLAPYGDQQSILSADEQQRAARFVFARDRERFIAARHLLRVLLAHYTQCNPGILEFGYGPYGKPFLTDTTIEFNLSHSDRIALIAISHVGQVGIDIERIRATVDYVSIAADLFSEHEYAELSVLPQALQRTAFFNCWVRKEAFVKACGAGLAMPLKQFDVSLRPNEPTRLLRIAHDQCERWSLHAIDASPGYAAALVVEGSARLRLFDACLLA